jgi:hypothetical protein
MPAILAVFKLIYIYIIFKDRSLGVPEHRQQKLSSRGLRLEFFGRRRRRVLPLHALPFGFWFVMMNPGFIPSDYA